MNTRQSASSVKRFIRKPHGHPAGAAMIPARGAGPLRRAPATRLPTLARLAAAVLLALGSLVAISTPAQAVTYRHLKSVKYGYCLFSGTDPLEAFHLYTCGDTPAKYLNWSATARGSYNGHPLWKIIRQGKSSGCLAILGNASNNYLYRSCKPDNWSNIWEVFTTSNGRLVFKSFGAFKTWGQHRCLTFDGPHGNGRPQLGACSLTSTADMIYK